MIPSAPYPPLTLCFAAVLPEYEEQAHDNATCTVAMKLWQPDSALKTTAQVRVVRSFFLPNPHSTLTCWYVYARSHRCEGGTRGGKWAPITWTGSECMMRQSMARRQPHRALTSGWQRWMGGLGVPSQLPALPQAAVQTVAVVMPFHQRPSQ